MTFDGTKYGGVLIKPKTTVESNKFDGTKYGGVLVGKEPQESYGRMAAQVPRNVSSGLGDVADLPIMGVNYLLDRAHKQINKAANRPETPNKFQLPYVGNKIAEGIDTLTGGYTAPQTKRERIAESGLRSLASLASGFGGGLKLAGSSIKGVAKLGRGLAKVNPLNPTSAAATGAGAVAQQAYREDRPDDLVGTLGTGLATDMAVRAGLGLFNNRNWANALKLDPKKFESFKKGDLSPTLGQVSDNHVVKSIENIIKETSPFDTLREHVGDQYKSIKETLGPGGQKSAKSSLQIGQTLQDKMKKYNERVSGFDLPGHMDSKGVPGPKGPRVPGIVGKMYKRFEDKVKKSPSGGLVDVTDSLGFFERLEKDLGLEVSKADLLKTPVGQQYTKLKQKSLANNGTVPLNDLMEYKRSIDELLTTFGTSGNITKGRLESMRTKVNDDITDYMKGIGAWKDWNRYNRFYQNFSEKRKKHLDEFKVQNLPAFEANKIFKSIGNSGDLDRSLLDTAYAVQKKPGQKETMDALIQKMGKEGDEFSPNLFAKRFLKQEPETKELFLKPLSVPMRGKFEGVMESIDAIKELNKFGNPSRTAYTNTIMQGAQLAPIMAYNYYSGNDTSDVAWHYALLTGIQYAASKGALTNPRFINWAYKGTQLKTPRSKINHIAGIQGVLGRPFYQELKNSLSEMKD